VESGKRLNLIVRGRLWAMKDRYLVTLEIETYDGDPKRWNWDYIFTGEDEVKVIESQFKGRVLPTSEGESND
jgi:hypothetical protein